MGNTEDNIDEETYVPLKDKRKLQNRKVAILVMTLIVLGTAMFFSIVMILRSGGMPRILFVIVALVLGYLIYEAVNKYKTISK